MIIFATVPQPASSPITSPAGLTRSRAIGIGLLIVTSVLWSISGVAVKLAEMHPLAFAFYRSLFAALVLALLLPWSKGVRPLGKWMLITIFFYAAVVALLITAMTRETAAKGILLQYSGPAFCALYAWLLQRRRIPGRSVLAIAIATVGIGIMIFGSEGLSGWIGPAAGLASGMSFGALILLLEKVDRVSGGRADPVWIVFVNNAGSALLLLPLCLWLDVLPISRLQLVSIMAIGVFQLALPYVLFQFALRRVHPVEASLLILLEPVLNPVWVALMTSERPDLATLVGGAAILGAMVLEATRPPPAPAQEHPGEGSADAHLAGATIAGSVSSRSVPIDARRS